MTKKKSILAQGEVNYKKAQADLKQLEENADNLKVKEYRTKKKSIETRIKKWSDLYKKQIIFDYIQNQMNGMRPASEVKMFKRFEAEAMNAAMIDGADRWNSDYSVVDYTSWARLALIMDYTEHYDERYHDWSLTRRSERDGFTYKDVDDNNGLCYNQLPDWVRRTEMYLTHQVILELMRVTNYAPVEDYEILPFTNYAIDRTPQRSAAASRAVLRRPEYWNELLSTLETLIYEFDESSDQTDDQTLDPKGTFKSLLQVYFDAFEDESLSNSSLANFKTGLEMNLNDYHSYVDGDDD